MENKGTTIQDRIRDFCREKKIPIRHFEIRCGMGNGYVNSIRKGNIGSDKLKNILTQFPELNRDWLMFGKGEMLNSQFDATDESQDKEESYEVLKAENSILKNWIKDKDAQLKEKDTQIRQLLDIIQNNSIHE